MGPCTTFARRRAGRRRVRDRATEVQRFDQASAIVVPSEAIRARADRLLGLPTLRAADAFQLAALLAAAEEPPAELPFVTLDGRLADAARREGFSVLPS